MPQILPVIHDDRRRRAWIHLWMVPAMFVTTAGVGAYAAMTGAGSTAAAFAVMASTVYAMGAVCWVVSLAFRLTVVPWAAEHAVNHGNPPAGFVALDRWAGALYVMHMASAYTAFALLGAAGRANTCDDAGTHPCGCGGSPVVSNVGLTLDEAQRVTASQMRSCGHPECVRYKE